MWEQDTGHLVNMGIHARNVGRWDTDPRRYRQWGWVELL